MELTDKVNEEFVHKHSKVITGYHTQDNNLNWRFKTKNLFSDEDESIEVRFFMLVRNNPSPQKSDAVRKLLKKMENTPVDWLTPSRNEWAFDLDRMKANFEVLKELDWCRGRVFVEPDFEIIKEDVDIGDNKYYETSVVFYLNPKVLNMTTPSILSNSPQCH
jgi:hypothetical protein